MDDSADDSKPGTAANPLRVRVTGVENFRRQQAGMANTMRVFADRNSEVAKALGTLASQRRTVSVLPAGFERFGEAASMKMIGGLGAAMGDQLRGRVGGDVWRQLGGLPDPLPAMNLPAPMSLDAVLSGTVMDPCVADVISGPRPSSDLEDVLRGPALESYAPVAERAVVARAVGQDVQVPDETLSPPVVEQGVPGLGWVKAGVLITAWGAVVSTAMLVLNWLMFQLLERG